MTQLHGLDDAESFIGPMLSPLVVTSKLYLVIMLSFAKPFAWLYGEFTGCVIRLAISLTRWSATAMSHVGVGVNNT